MQQSDVSNLRDTIIPKSDQLNADQLLGGPITITVTEVKRGSPDQPVTIHYQGDGGRPYKPCKSMRKVLIFAWGEDGNQWAGRSMTLYNNPEVSFGGMKVGGIRISHLSHIDKNISLALTSTKGKKNEHTIAKLDVRKSPVEVAKDSLNTAAANGTDALRTAWTGLTKELRGQIGEAYLRGCQTKAAEADRINQPPAESPANTNSAETSSQAAPEPEPAPAAPADGGDGFDF
jgi:hypothetical protein